LDAITFGWGIRIDVSFCAFDSHDKKETDLFLYKPKKRLQGKEEILACRVVESITSLSFGRESSQVTGSSQGIGKAVAIGLSQAGATVLVTGTNPERTKKVTEEVAQLTGRETDYFIGDLSKDENVI
jgi:3-oxoacyl-ACP reductase-like protein